MDTFEDAAIAHKVAWDIGEFDAAAALLRRAKELVGNKGRVVQMGDGALQVVPNE